MGKALIVVDMQKQFYTEKSKEMMDKAVETINKAVGLFRSKHQRVIWIQHENKKTNLYAGQRDFEIIDSLLPGQNEKIIIKTRGNGFLGTELGDYLNKNALTELYFCGYAAEACVNKTYNGGKDLGYSVHKLRNGIDRKSVV